MIDPYAELIQLDEKIRAGLQEARGRMARVISAEDGYATVEIPVAGDNGSLVWDGPLGPYPSTIKDLNQGAVGVLLPIRGGRRLFIALGFEGTTLELGGDGSSPYAAHADHEHRADGGPSGSLRIGKNSVSVDRGIAIGNNAEAHDAAIAIGIASKAFGYVASALGYEAEAAGQYAVALAYKARALFTGAVALGYNALANGNYAVALGYASSAVSYAIAVGRNVVASGGFSTAIGDNATASGTRSIAIGANANNPTADKAVMKTNELWLEQSSGTGRTRLVVYSSGNIAKQIVVNDDDTMLVGSETIRGGGNIEKLMPPNRKVGSSAAPLKSYPSNNAGGVAMPAGRAFYATGPVSAEGYSWYVCWNNYGVGYIRSDLTVAL